MNLNRLHSLTDGIFAIAMTLLVLELKVPALGQISNQSLWQALSSEWTVFFAYIISFALLFTYWRGYNAMMGSLAKNLDPGLTQINIVFLMLVALIPFSTSVLSQYKTTQVGIGIYAANIALISLTLVWARSYALRHDEIEISEVWKPRDHRNATVRAVVPNVVCLLAFLVSYYSSTAALAMITLVAFLNVFSWGFEPILQLLDRLNIGLE